MADPYAGTPAAGNHGTFVDPETGVPFTKAELQTLFGGGTSVASVTLADNSITSATGASQQLLAANTARKALTIINVAATDWTIDPLGGTAAAGTTPGFVLHPGDEWSPRPAPTNKITGIGTSTSKLVVLEG